MIQLGLALAIIENPIESWLNRGQAQVTEGAACSFGREVTAVDEEQAVSVAIGALSGTGAESGLWVEQRDAWKLRCRLLKQRDGERDAWLGDGRRDSRIGGVRSSQPVRQSAARGDAGGADRQHGVEVKVGCIFDDDDLLTRFLERADRGCQRLGEKLAGCFERGRCGLGRTVGGQPSVHPVSIEGGSP